MRERELLGGRRPGLADVVPGDRDRVPERHLGRCRTRSGRRPGACAGRSGTIHSFWAMNSLRMSVCSVPRQARGGDTPRSSAAATNSASATGAGPEIVIDVETAPRSMPSYRRRTVVGRGDRDALAADLALRQRVVGVVAHQRRHVEGRREARLALREQVAEAGVRVLRRAEAGEHAHRPEARAVHLGVEPARVRVLARRRRVGRGCVGRRRRPAASGMPDMVLVGRLRRELGVHLSDLRLF